MQEADLIGLGAGEGLSILHALLGFKLSFPVDSQGGVADVYVDGVKRGTVSFYGATAGRAHAPFVGLDAGKGRLAWTGLLDLDLYLVDPTGSAWRAAPRRRIPRISSSR